MDEQKTQTSAQPEHIPLLLIARELWRKLGLILMFAATVAAWRAAQTALGNATRALLTSIGGIGGGDVNTKVVVTSAGNDRYVLPSEVRIGNQVDTVRRRRNGVRETYTTY